MMQTTKHAVRKQLGLDFVAGIDEDTGNVQRCVIPEIRGNDLEFLQSRSKQQNCDDIEQRPAVPLIDLFCGVGGLSLGFHEALKQVGLAPYTALAIDSDQDALACYRANLGGAASSASDIREIFSTDFNAKFSSIELDLKHQIPTGAILLGGPPCQGHSDLNNLTRRNDPKNLLYFIMARAAKVLQPEFIVIENVPTVVHDKGGVVELTRRALASLGYHVHEQVLDLLKLGVPQTRKRHLMVAGRHHHFGGRLADLSKLRVPSRTVEWAISDLANLPARESLIDEVAKPNVTTRDRIDFLFENDLYDLPNSQRPPCHRLKKHSYSSIYGRLRWDSPAQTVTRGFYSMCMGRHVHPSHRRTLTAHEAARLQFFPDWFRFDDAKSRTKLAMMIGNAVPAKLGFVVGLELVTGLELKGNHVR